MKKSSILPLLALAIIMLISSNLSAQKFKGLDKSPMDAAAYPTSYKEANKAIKIIYSRPQLKGRDLSTLAPNGKVWRTGANEAPELTLYEDMNLGNTLIEAGTYTFYVIPGDKEWIAIISKDINAWGAYTYNEANDVARLSVPVSSSKESLEAFSIVFDEGNNAINMHLGWGTIRVTVPFTK
ncbi:DUF2911 domain-containing protein [Seonamhaeicola sediminis]|uniref:DUF2911 domain-containing protein n=1 Tax=Seonamhaeicola sediminis TaxID=2528206 RepID=A0A562YCV9_9FLAO|nr:DUF2911 domain-containing protein [Seonamhaeicola sediminis]TWO32527.1 DUF2911 domain-containing protein [Seonamhaeicola sediminis]